MNTTEGIVDHERNPFVQPSWIEQGCRLTPGRQTELERLFGRTAKDIMDEGGNHVRYPAFVGVRWGFAELNNGVLTPTAKWENRERFDGYGNPLAAAVTPTGNTPTAATKRANTKNTPTAQTRKDSAAPAAAGPLSIPELKAEMERRRILLVQHARRDDVSMDPVEREHILLYLEQLRFPEKPDTETRLMKEFVSSALSINQPPHRIRNKMKQILKMLMPVIYTFRLLCQDKLAEINNVPTAYA